MKIFHLLSRRNVAAEKKADFRPDDPKGLSPFAQLRRLQRALTDNEALPEDFTDMDEALEAWREMTYRKVFSGTTHDDFVKLDKDDPRKIDWLLAVASVDQSAWEERKRQR